MDLGAFAQIDDLESIANANNIKIPRLRGYRLMSNEDPIHIDKSMKKSSIEINTAEYVLEAIWDLNKGWRESSPTTDAYKRHYLNWHKEDGRIIYDSIRWERIHGKHRKILKFEIKKSMKARIKQWKTFNKYVGREDVLMIHSRIGGNNWNYYGGPELEKEPWFLERVDDSYDSTYCDIYAKIKREEDNEINL